MKYREETRIREFEGTTDELKALGLQVSTKETNVVLENKTPNPVELELFSDGQRVKTKRPGRKKFEHWKNEKEAAQKFSLNEEYLAKCLEEGKGYCKIGEIEYWYDSDYKSHCYYERKKTY